MPPQYASDSSSDESVIAPVKKTPTRSAPSSTRSTRNPKTVELPDDEDEVMNDGEDAHEDGDDGDGEEYGDEDDGDDEEYIVEAILDHKFVNKELMLQVKWKGYDKKSDLTWEPEANCEGAQEAVNEYFAKIGGRPARPSPAPRKRSRPSTASTARTPPASTSTKSKRARTSLAVSNLPKHSDAWDSDDDGANGAGSGKKRRRGRNGKGWDDGEDEWNAPPGNKWETEIAHVDTIERGEDGGLVVYVQWKEGRKSRHPIDDVYKNCPQRMLHFYEQHLVFRDTTV